MFAKMGPSGNLAGLTIVCIAQTVPVSIYMMKDYFVTVPYGIEEVAALDGCSRPQIARRVIPVETAVLDRDRTSCLRGRLD